ncbi:MAG: hypothetical protein OSA48_02480 [Akkermansiaceae bacterium]|nr:hypothetical protein [Akkermansiaceae bacterium]
MKRASTSILVIALGALPLHADQLTLEGGDQLTGTLLEIPDESRITFETPNATNPLQLKSSAVKSIQFEYEAPKDIPQSERLVLRNGDTFPGEIINLDSEYLDLRTWACGDLRIPRSAIASVAFGVAPHNLVFSGPKNEAGWKDNENWSFGDQSLSSAKRGTISRLDVLPEQFILRFQLKWETNPNFRFYFCDDFLQRNGDTDRYYFEVNSGGMQLKRQATGNKNRRWSPLYSSQRRPESFPDHNMEIEIRVDRHGRMLYIYVDGEDEGRLDDPIGEIPLGSGIMLESLAGGDMKNIVSSIEIYHWDAVSQIHRNEGHKNPDTDAVVTTESERYEGSADQLVGEGQDRAILIKSPHTDEPVRIPFNALSVLYFREPKKMDSSPCDFHLSLAAQGRVAVNNPTLSLDSMSADHPLLGEISIRRDSIMSLQAAPHSEPTP